MPAFCKWIKGTDENNVAPSQAGIGLALRNRIQVDISLVIAAAFGKLSAFSSLHLTIIDGADIIIDINIKPHTLAVQQ